MNKIKSVVYKIFFYLFLLVVTVFSLFPFYYAIVTSLKSKSELFSVDLLLNKIQLTNYQSVLTNDSFLWSIVNSVLVASAVVGISLLAAVTAAYALGRIEFKGRRTLMVIVLAVSMFPQVAVLAGLFEVIRWFDLYNNLLSLVISYTLFTLPFTVWVLTTFMRQLPKELEDAALIDGATPWTTLVKILMPLIWPAVITTGLLAFIAAWNEFLFALTFTLTDDQRTVPVAIALISGSSQHELPWGNIMAASVIVTIPLIILLLIFQRRIVSGLTAGAVKG
ncbi:carbohydrate ABC transporter permease [Spartinivicinus poritis]|uniref:Carbohydrate ABC transporter permease n=1 Tax=Spartinivicinus poritis TaxID=2994640 RepID=A0ABT5UDW1_9GAMM|nr:carbohydrate ABC transporter permease [Spartinivicinus sp. A2-2]MDE1464553.1 carbohydrate ABC transporter permease [Spartinivicinus sp. A2-2]